MRPNCSLLHRMILHTFRLLGRACLAGQRPRSPKSDENWSLQVLVEKRIREANDPSFLMSLAIRIKGGIEKHHQANVFQRNRPYLMLVHSTLTLFDNIIALLLQLKGSILVFSRNERMSRGSIGSAVASQPSDFAIGAHHFVHPGTVKFCRLREETTGTLNEGQNLLSILVHVPIQAVILILYDPDTRNHGNLISFLRFLHVPQFHR